MARGQLAPAAADSSTSRRHSTPAPRKHTISHTAPVPLDSRTQFRALGCGRALYVPLSCAFAQGSCMDGQISTAAQTPPRVRSTNRSRLAYAYAHVHVHVSGEGKTPLARGRRGAAVLQFCSPCCLRLSPWWAFDY